MKKMIVIFLALLLCLGVALAEDGAGIEVLRLDGVPVVVLYFAEDAAQFRGAAQDGFALPEALTEIGESAFEGIAAEIVVITENVISIGPRAFADCASLREIHIPASVQEIDGTALQGCQSVTVYGCTDTAKAFAEINGFTYIDGAVPPGQSPAVRENPPITLPFVPAN